MEKASGESFARTTRKTAEDDGDGENDGDIWRESVSVWQFVNSRLGAILLRAEGFNFKNPLTISSHHFRKILRGKEIQQRALRDSNPRPTD